MSTGTTEQDEFEVTVEREDFEYHATVTVPESGPVSLQITRRFPDSPSKENRDLHGVFQMPKYLHHLEAIAELVEKAETKLEDMDRD